MANLSLLPFERYVTDPVNRYLGRDSIYHSRDNLWNWEKYDRFWNRSQHDISPEYLNSLANLPLYQNRARSTSPVRRSYYFEPRSTSPVRRSYYFEPHPNQDSFKVLIDVSQFFPNEIKVRTFDNCVIIEGKHFERRDGHGYIARQFTRKYTLPYGYDTSEIYSTLSSDGILTVEAPPSPPPRQVTFERTNERNVKVERIGPSYLKY